MSPEVKGRDTTQFIRKKYVNVTLRCFFQVSRYRVAEVSHARGIKISETSILTKKASAVFYRK